MVRRASAAWAAQHLACPAGSVVVIEDGLQLSQEMGVAAGVGGLIVGVVGRAHPSCTAMPVKCGSTPPAFIASTPRLSCTVISTYLPVEAECTHRSRHATRNAVS